MKRLLVILIAAAAMGLFAASPAEAAPSGNADGATATADTGAMTVRACGDYLRAKGYEIGPKVDRACHEGNAHQTPACAAHLRDAGVTKSHAIGACKRAESK